MKNQFNDVAVIPKLKETDSLEDLLSQHEYTLLFFSALWCGPCQSMTPIVTEVASLMRTRCNTIKVDVDSLPNHAADFGIRSVPTLVLVKNGEIIGQLVGGLPQSQLLQWLEQRT